MFGSNNRLVTGGPAPPAAAAQDIDEVQTEVMGFTSLGEDKKLRFLPKPWPENNLPKPTSSLFSVASIAGLVAAADPDSLIIASTEDVRNAFSKQGDFENKIVPYDPQLKIPIGTRLSQVCFSSDNEYLVVCAEDGGGLQVYKTAALKQGDTQFAFQYATNGIAVRSIVPNPVDGRVFAIVLGNGMLALAEIKVQGTGAEMKPLKESGVSCVSWSVRGKQLVAGLEDGTIAQLQPNGTHVVSVPKPPQLSESAHVGSLVWLDNDNFLVVYNPNQFNQDSPPESASFMVRRIGKNESFEYRKFAFEPAPAFGMNRAPPHHFFSRVRDYEPSLKDAIIISNTCSSDIGLVAKYTDKLSPDQANIIDSYAMLGLEDNRKALLPDKPDDMDSPYTSPLGTAIDLSSTSQVKRPLPKEENLDVTGPLPAYMILNNEGILSAWWFIHESAIKQNAPYKQLIVNGGPQVAAAAQTPVSGQAQQTSPFASATKPQAAPGFGTPSVLGQQKPAFGQPSTFGSPSPLGQAKPAFGQSGFASAASSQPSFGQPSAPAFGQTSPFGSASSLGLGTNTKTFGSAAAGGATNQSPFASLGQNKNASSPFAAVKDGSSGSSGSIFGSNNNSQTNAPLFGSKANSNTSTFGTFGKKDESNQSSFGAAAGKDAAAKAPFSNTSTASPFGSVNQPEGGSIFQRKPTPPDSPFAVLKKEQQGTSFGSTVTIGSTLGTNTSFGVSSLSGKSPFATPALSNQPSEVARPSTERPSNQRDSDMNMDGLSGLGLGGDKKDEDREETPKPETKPADAVPVKAEATEPPLPPDPFASKPIKKEEGAEGTSLPPEAASLPAEDTTKNVVPEPAPLPPSPKPAKEVPADSASSSPFATPLKKEEPSKTFSLFPPKQEKKPSSPLARAPTPPVDFKPEESPTRESSALGSEPEDLGNDSAYVDSPTRSQLPQSEEDDTQVSAVNTWPRSPRAKQPPLPVFGQQSPAPSQPTEANTPLFSPDTATKAPLGQTPFSSKPTFQPPQHVPGSPRSPSPVREQQVPGRRMMQPRRSSGSPSRSASRSPQRATSMNQVMTAQPQQQQQRIPTPQQLPPVKEAPPTPAAPTQPPSKPKPRPEDLELDEQAEAEEQDQRAKLNDPLEPSITLGAFEAHADYVGHIKSSTLASQLERLYRDVESMIDTLAWNSRTMEAFVRGHTETFKDGRTLDDLEPEHQSGWTLVELEDLKSLAQDLAVRLEQGRPQNVRAIQGECREFLTTTSTLTKQAFSIERQLAEIKAAQDASAKSTPRARLSADQSNTLATLRTAQARLLETLRQAEESASVLRAQVAAAAAGSSDSSAPEQVPTVEAVTNTIAKMTRMAEQKRGDVDHLESVVRRLRRERRMPPRDPTPDLAALSLADRDSATPRKPAPATPDRAAREASDGSFAVPADSDSDAGPDDDAAHAARAEAAHLRVTLRRARDRLVRRLPNARLSPDDIADRRVERARRARVMDVLRDVVVARHREELEALRASHAARLEADGEESAAALEADGS